MRGRRWKLSWGDHWVWPLVGCGLILAVPLLFGGAGAVRAFVLSKQLGSDTLKAAGIKEAKGDPAVIARIGEPIEIGETLESHVAKENGQASAHFVVELTGPKGKCYVQIAGVHAHGRWVVDRIALVDIIDAFRNQDIKQPPRRGYKSLTPR